MLQNNKNKKYFLLFFLTLTKLYLYRRNIHII